MEPLSVGFDGGCGPCRTIWGLVLTLDHGRGRVVGVDVNDPAAVDASVLADCDRVALVLDMHARRGSETTVGFAAWRSIARTVPLLWPALLVLAFPGVDRIGERAYRRIADRRSCAVERHRSGEAVRT